MFEWMKNFVLELFNRNETETIQLAAPVEQKQRQSSTSKITSIMEDLFGINPDIPFEMLDIIEKLIWTTPDLSQTVKRTMQLGNTGHTVSFEGLSDLQSKAANEELENFSTQIFQPGAGMDSLVNAMFIQLLTKGAISIEAVPSMMLDGIEKVVFVPVKSVRFKRKDGKLIPIQISSVGEIELNMNQYMYIPLLQKENNPYAIPPFIAAIESVMMQKDSISNIKSIINKFGLLGFIFAQKKVPTNDGKSHSEFQDYLAKELAKFAESFRQNFKSGAAVGYDDVDLKHYNISNDSRGASDLFQLIEQQVASGIDIDPALLGRTYSTTETYAGVVYAAFLSSLNNMRRLIKRSLEKVYFLHLVMKGYPVKKVRVTFNKDRQLKPLDEANAEKTKTETVILKLDAGLIDPDTAAKELGYEKATGTPRKSPQTPLSERGAYPLSEEDEKKKSFTLIGAIDQSGCECGSIHSLVKLGAITPDQAAIYQAIEDNFAKTFFASYEDRVKNLFASIDPKLSKEDFTKAILDGIEWELGEKFQSDYRASFAQALSDSWDAGQSIVGNGRDRSIPTAAINSEIQTFFATSMKIDIGNQFRYQVTPLDNGFETRRKQNEKLFTDAINQALETGNPSKALKELETAFFGELPDGRTAQGKEALAKIKELRDKMDYTFRGQLYRAQTFSQIQRMNAVGITTVEVVAILDQKTSEICRLMNGRKFSVETLMSFVTEFTSDDPTTPAFWQKYKNPPQEALRDWGKLNDKEVLSRIPNKLPPYHVRCRTTVVMANTIKEASTTQEAEKIAKDAGLAQTVNYQDVPVYVANEVNQTLFGLKEKLGITYNEIKSEDLGNSIMRSSDSYLKINNAFFSKPEMNSIENVNAFISKISNKIVDGKNYWNAETLKDLVNHEFGHRLTLKKYKELTNGRGQYDRDNIVSSEFNTSAYSDTNAKERLAEIFVLIQKGLITDRKFIDEFNKYSEVRF